MGVGLLRFPEGPVPRPTKVKKRLFWSKWRHSRTPQSGTFDKFIMSPRGFHDGYMARCPWGVISGLRFLMWKNMGNMLHFFWPDLTVISVKSLSPGLPGFHTEITGSRGQRYFGALSDPGGQREFWSNTETNIRPPFAKNDPFLAHFWARKWQKWKSVKISLVSIFKNPKMTF